MTATQAVLTFTVAAGLLTITPGLDTALVLRTAANAGARKAMLAGIGICLGLSGLGVCCCRWGCSTTVASSLLYGTLRIVDALYLSYLGLRILFGASKRRFDEALNSIEQSDSQASDWFLRGLLTNLLNPKVGVFYVAFLPQFVPAGIPVAPFSMLLAAIHAAQGLLWFAVLTLATERLMRGLRRPSLPKTLDQLTGLLSLGFVPWPFGAGQRANGFFHGVWLFSNGPEAISQRTCAVAVAGVQPA